MRNLFILHGLGDERRVLFHARLPIQFGEDGNDVITVFENGDHGDGTTRTFVESFSVAMDEIRENGLVDCPNAEEDELVHRVLSLTQHHDRWRGLDPRGPELPDSLRSDLGLDGNDRLGRLLQLLHGHETVGIQQFHFFDLALEVRAVEADLHKALPRAPNTWELVTAAVHRAQQGDMPVLSALLSSYRVLEGGLLEEGLRPEERLADQIYRFGSRLCPDGCEACLHGGSDLMSDSQARASLSRIIFSLSEK